MNDEARDLLMRLNQKYLNDALNAYPGSEEEKAAHELAMDSTDRLISIAKNDDSYREHCDKLEAEKEARTSENESKKNDRKWNIIMKVGEITIGVVVMPLIILGLKQKYGDRIMKWETDGNSFTLEAAKANVRDLLHLK